VIVTDSLKRALNAVPLQRRRGKVLEAVGPVLEAELPGVRVGGICHIGDCLAEVVGFRGRRALLMPLDSAHGVTWGAEVIAGDDAIHVPVGDELIGRVVDGLGRAVDGRGVIDARHRRRVHAVAPNPLKRSLIKDQLVTGVRVLDAMTPVGVGQRMCIIAGSGVGKSTLLGMIARNVQADVNVICLVGERGREVREFLELNLGPEGRARSVMVVVTSDRSPAMAVKGAFVATTIAEAFRDQGKNVLFLMDSLTRFAIAQRQIGLAAGEPPATRGYTPSVFTLLPALLERAGPGEDGRGSITGVYTVLVEGDDVHDPVADAVRGIVDGHIVLSRKLASHGRFPAVDVLGSLSRLGGRVADPRSFQASQKVRDVMAIWAENEELIRLGAYRRGSSKEIDRAISMEASIREFLAQDVDEAAPMANTVARIGKLGIEASR